MKTLTFEIKPSSHVRCLVWDDAECVDIGEFRPGWTPAKIAEFVHVMHPTAKLHAMYRNRTFPAKAGMVRKIGQIVSEGMRQ